MCSQAVPLPARQLKKSFLNATSRSTLGGASVLRGLATIARRCCQGVSPSHRVVAYCLFKLLDALSYDRDERQVSAEETRDLLDLAYNPMLAAIEFLSEDDDESKAVAIASELVAIESRTIPKP